MSKQAQIVQTPNGFQYAAPRQWPMSVAAQRAHGFLATVNRSITGRVVKLAGDRSGVTALEYGIIAGVLGLVLLLVMSHLGLSMKTLFNTIGKAV